MVFLVDAEKSAKAHHAEQNAVRLLVEHDVFNLADLLSSKISDICFQ
jgi:hypothetical protein